MKEYEKFKVMEIKEKTAVLATQNQSQKEVPKYRLPLHCEEGQILYLNEFGMLDIMK